MGTWKKGKGSKETRKNAFSSFILCLIDAASVIVYKLAEVKFVIA